MIKVNGYKCEVKGTVEELILELMMAIRSIGYIEKLIPKEQLINMLDSAYLSEEEIHNKCISILNSKSEAFKELAELLEQEYKNKNSNSEDVIKKMFNDILRDDK